MPALAFSVDEVLTTTRSVRRRLVLDRPVDPGLLEECLRIAQQAPTASNMTGTYFLVVTDPDKRKGLAELFRRGFDAYRAMLAAGPVSQDATQAAGRPRMRESVRHLVEHLHEVPVHVIPCVRGRVDGLPTVLQSATWGSVAPATWSFMLAARSRGLGTCWTSMHLFHEAEAAEILGVPHDEVTQTGLIPVAHTEGEFKPAYRPPLETVVYWDRWGAGR